MLIEPSLLKVDPPIAPEPMTKKGIKLMNPAVPCIAKNGLNILHEIFGLGVQTPPTPNLSDVVLIAIDFENINTIKSGFAEKRDCQIGLAILDTKEIHRQAPNTLVSTYNLATGSPFNLRKASEKFIFGETITISTADVAERIQSYIPPARNIVFVGYGIINDLQALQALDFQFPALLSSVLDTSQVANNVFEIWGGSLGDLLLKLSCSFNRLHCAGNDANFTLRALLLLASEGFTRQQRFQTEDCDTLAILRQISHDPIPCWTDPEVAALEKREKRREKSRKHQSKTWSKEKQAEIRAARQLTKERDMAFS
ncbi:hypothetical protein BU24DRAFT_492267 [Aaosphaeria arxii CBS 175.79]|uniref:Gfd2/YDR514C-like C-terminal domain-containing protein n=1 Tax=Aaosphaeria arxii CBS 175.79 TaxID=1450172 RepID=A0A6A5XT67_9PLEO|nr:uncharacterized protein BU24DRAFT_492267 [Aaosphaeria arxii CBS 175.79]KAF2016109.1 hypothetical protein BU24DRAFT_492267 [Aaosphaeria arxii CBS 175.79]